MRRVNFFRTTCSLQTSPLGILLGLGFSLYVYRFSLGGANLTLLRIVLLILGIRLLATFKLSRLPRYGILIGGISAVIGLNGFWYPTLGEYPIPQRGMISHLVNLLLLLELVIYINSEQRLRSVLNGYLIAAIPAIGIGYYGWICREIPFEQLLRSYSTIANVPYVIVDGDFVRLSGPFMDPNFFGVYLLTVCIYALWSYHFRNRNLWYLFLSMAALCTLPLTLSRTAMIGLLVFLAVYATWLPRRTGKVLMVGLLPLSLLGLLVLMVFSENIVDRLLNPESILERLRFIDKGWQAFIAHPFFGSGPAGIVDEATGIATAHLMYLSIAAKFGLIGAIPYMVFLLYPLGRVMIRPRTLLPEYSTLVIALYLPLLMMYLLYDFLYFLEFQYLIFAVGYSVALSPYARRPERKVVCAAPSPDLTATGITLEGGDAKCTD